MSEGFPRGRAIPVPAAFFRDVLPQIADLAELKITLHVLWRLAEKRSFPRYVSESELDTDRVLLQSLGSAGPPLQELRRGIALAIARGTFADLMIDIEGRSERLVFVNGEQERKAMARIEAGEIDLGQTAIHRTQSRPEILRPNVFALYEQNIGLLTPLIADELREAEKDYPAEWLEEAMRIAASANRRSWRYISRILERWRVEGKDDGAARSNTTPDSWERYVRPEKWRTGPDA